MVGDHGRAVEAVRAAPKSIHDAAVKRELDAIPVARLQDVAEGRLRLGSAERGGLRTVGQVLEADPYRSEAWEGLRRRSGSCGGYSVSASDSESKGRQRPSVGRAALLVDGL
ncbi:hypothetical protein GCM10020367_41240 [Streptomyces sannanensis]|uniref:Uncharacterized protein n=1 Tax=Streptomyces sannanensis TaxID=285536 RepID=A0ABP6SF49_9ACTN